LPLLQVGAGEPLRGWVSSIELHVASRPEDFEPAVRRAIAEVDPNLTALRIVSFDEQVGCNFNQDRLIARLAELFGVLALILACVGLYSVTAYAVTRRTNEIGIRMAMGAERTSILAWVMRSALGQVALGMAIGIPAAVAGGQVLADQLYGVKNYDPMIVGLAATVLVACALLAAAIPARRASGVDPMVALRYE
jgi:ABC-type lipoprotein release transport system permease subunit